LVKGSHLGGHRRVSHYWAAETGFGTNVDRERQPDREGDSGLQPALQRGLACGEEGKRIGEMKQREEREMRNLATKSAFSQRAAQSDQNC